jgi:PAS domain S-box-containing protein
MKEATTAAGRRIFHQTRHRAWAWIKDRTLGASWLPSWLRHPWAGVLIGLVLIGANFVVVPLLLPQYKGVPLEVLLLFLAIALTAIMWGTGPSLVVTLVGIVMINHIQWYPYPALEPESVPLTLEDLIVLAVGLLIGYLAGQNVAAQNRVEQMRKLSDAERRRLDTVLEVLPTAMALSDKDGNLVQNNRRFKEIAGADAQLVTAAEHARFQARWPDTGLPVSEDQWALSRALQQGEVCPGEEVELVTIAGQHKVILNAAAPIRDDQGMISGGVVAFMDITEDKRREQQVRESLHALLALAEALIGPTELPPPRDEDGAAPESLAMGRYAELIQDIFSCRQVYVGTLNVATRQYTLRGVAGLSPVEESRLNAWLKGVDLGDYVTAEQRADLASGSSIVVHAAHNVRIARDFGMPPGASLVIAPLRWEGRLIGLLGLTYLEDQAPYGQETQRLVEVSARLGEIILERERIVAQREEARATAKAMEETTKQMDAFLGMTTHELKTPLTAMLLSVQLSRRRLESILRQSGETNDRFLAIADGLVKLESQGKKLDRLVNDLLDLSRFQAGKLQVHPERTDLRLLVQRTVEEQQKVAATRIIRLHLPQADEPIMVQADSDRIAQVVANYLTNALKYSPADAPVEVGLDVTGPLARVWVRDEGPGLPEGEQERIWQRYHRTSGIEVQSGTGVGLGLGLSIVRHIIELHGGTVGVESAPEQGSTFWFTLPRAEETAPLEETSRGA